MYIDHITTTFLYLTVKKFLSAALGFIAVWMLWLCRDYNGLVSYQVAGLADYILSPKRIRAVSKNSSTAAIVVLATVIILEPLVDYYTNVMQLVNPQLRKPIMTFYNYNQTSPYTTTQTSLPARQYFDLDGKLTKSGSELLATLAGLQNDTLTDSFWPPVRPQRAVVPEIYLSTDLNNDVSGLVYDNTTHVFGFAYNFITAVDAPSYTQVYNDTYLKFVRYNLSSSDINMVPSDLMSPTAIMDDFPFRGPVDTALAQGLPKTLNQGGEGENLSIRELTYTMATNNTYLHSVWSVYWQDRMPANNLTEIPQSSDALIKMFSNVSSEIPCYGFLYDNLVHLGEQTPNSTMDIFHILDDGTACLFSSLAIEQMPGQLFYDLSLSMHVVYANTTADLIDVIYDPVPVYAEYGISTNFPWKQLNNTQAIVGSLWFYDYSAFPISKMDVGYCPGSCYSDTAVLNTPKHHLVTRTLSPNDLVALTVTNHNPIGSMTTVYVLGTEFTMLGWALFFLPILLAVISFTMQRWSVPPAFRALLPDTIEATADPASSICAKPSAGLKKWKLERDRTRQHMWVTVGNRTLQMVDVTQLDEHLELVDKQYGSGHLVSTLISLIRNNLNAVDEELLRKLYLTIATNPYNYRHVAVSCFGEIDLLATCLSRDKRLPLLKSCPQLSNIRVANSVLLTTLDVLTGRLLTTTVQDCAKSGMERTAESMLTRLIDRFHSLLAEAERDEENISDDDIEDAFEAIETGMSVDPECFEVAHEEGSSKMKTEQAEPSVTPSIIMESHSTWIDHESAY